MELTELASLLKPYIVSYLDETLVSVAYGGDSDGSGLASQLAAHVSDTNIHHNRQHSIISGIDHTVSGNAFDVVGLVATDTIGVITPSANVGVESALLRTDSSGNVAFQGLTVSTISAQSDEDLVIDADVGKDVHITAGRVSINKTDPDYALDVEGIGAFSSKVLTAEVESASGNLTLDPESGKVTTDGWLIANRGIASAPSYSIPSDLSYSLYVDGESSAGVFSAGTEAWGKSGFVSFNAYQVRPRPNDGNPATAGNMKFYGGNAGTTRAHLQVFDGNAGTYKVYVSPSTYSDGDAITWTELTNLTSTGALSVVDDVSSGASVSAVTSVITPLLTTSSGDLLINPAASVKFTNAQTLVTQSFDSSFPIEGWQISQTAISNQSQITIGVGAFDELRVRVFVADETRVDRGNEFWTKSYGILAEEFTTPSSIGGTVTVTFEDSPALSGAIFSNNDWILFQVLDIDTGIVLLNVWGQVSGYSDNGDGTQDWTFTLRQGATDERIRKGQAGIDFGQSGAALIHLSTVDPNGAPYIKMRTWSGANPYTPSNFETHVQIGELGSKSNPNYTPVGYGLYVQQTDNDDRFLVIDDNGFRMHGADLKMFDGSTQTVNIDYEGTNFWLGQGLSDKVFLFDGTSLSLLANNTAVITLDTSGNSYFAGVMTIGTSGEIRQGTGSLTVDYTGLRIWRDTGVGRIGGYNDDVLQWYADTDGLLYAGSGNVQLGRDGLNLQQDSNVSPDSARAISWWADIGDQSGDPTQSISAFTNGTSFRNVLLLQANSSGLFDAYVTLGANTDFVELISGSGFWVNTNSYTKHLYPQADNTYDIGDGDFRYRNLHVANLHVDTIVGTPTYAHSHDASDITTGTLALGRIPTNLTGKNADLLDGYHASSFSLVGHTHSYLPLSGGELSGNITFSGSQTVDGVDISAFKTAYDSHTHDSRYYTETEVNSLLAGYMLKTWTLTAGGGLSGGGSGASNRTISHDDTSSQESVNNSSYTVIQDVTLDDYGHVTGLASVDASAMLTGYLKADGTITGATSQAQNFTYSVYASTIGTSNQGGISIGSPSMPAQTALYIEKFYPSFSIVAARTSGLFAASLMQAGGKNLTSGLSATVASVGVLGNLQTSPTAPTLSYLYISSLPAPAYNNANLFMLPSGRIGIGAANSSPAAWLDIKGSTANEAALRLRSGTEPTSPNAGDIWYASAGNLYLSDGTNNWSVGADIYGDTLELDSDATIYGILTVSPNSDVITELGNAKIGWADGTDTATFSHYDHNSSTAFALSQYSSGATMVNAASGQYVDIGVNATSTLTINADRVLPRGNMQVGLGDYNRKFSDLHAFELIVENLVAQDVMATIGGRIVVAPTTYLSADVALAGANTFTAEHNNLFSGDFAYMAAFIDGLPQVEYLRLHSNPIGSGPYSYSVERQAQASNTTTLLNSMTSGTTTMDTVGSSLSVNDYVQLSDYANAKLETVRVTAGPSVITGGYRYTVTRNATSLATGAKAWDAGQGVKIISKLWYEGNAIVMTGGNVGEGYIELTSTETLLSQYGPTISITSRTDADVWNGLTEVVALGNLRSRVDYGGNEDYGLVIGNDTSLTPTTGFSGITADASDGLRLFNTDIALYNGGTQTVDISATGNIKAGTNVSSAATTSFDFDSDTGALRVGFLGTNKPNLYYNASAGTLSLRNNTTDAITLYSDGSSYFSGIMQIGTSGEIRQGSGTFGSDFTGLRIWRDSGVGRIAGYSSDTAQWYAGSDGKMYAGAGAVKFDNNGVSIAANTSLGALENRRSVNFFNGLELIGQLSSYADATYGEGVYLASTFTTGGSGKRRLELAAFSPNSDGQTLIRAVGNSIHNASIDLTASSAGVTEIYISADDVVINGDLDLNGNDITDIGTIGETWTGITFGSGWTNFGGSWNNVGYKKVGDLVFVRGMATRSSGTGTTVATLPIGYRPSAHQKYLCATSPVGTNQEVNINTDGTITLVGTAYSTYLSLSGIVFSTI